MSRECVQADSYPADLKALVRSQPLFYHKTQPDLYQIIFYHLTDFFSSGLSTFATG